MKYLLNQVKCKNHGIFAVYEEANKIWAECLSDYSDKKFKDLAQKLPTMQIKFEQLVERNGGDRWDGQEVMVLSGLSYYMSGTHEDSKLAESIAKAIQYSSCSIEVVGLAKRIAIALYIEVQ